MSLTTPEKEDWMQKKWRPMMAVLYMGVCAFDFVIAPVLWSIIQILTNSGHIATQWQPLTLQGAGLLHLSFGAILGVAAYGRTQEKLAGTASNVGTTYTSPLPTSAQPAGVTPAVLTPSAGSFAQGAPTTSFSQPQTFVSKQGKPGPVIEEPEL